MMALRCVEYCLRDWYLHETGTEIEQSWGRVLAALEGEFENKDRPAVLSNLDYLRERRNEVNHPVRNPDYKEAEDTLVAVRQTVTEIYRQMD